MARRCVDLLRSGDDVIAPPIPGTRSCGIIQFAMLPSPSTSSAPSTVTSTCAPRIIAKLSSAETSAPPAALARASRPLYYAQVVFVLARPRVYHAVFRLSMTRNALRQVVRHELRDSDAEVDERAVLELRGDCARYPRRASLSLSSGSIAALLFHHERVDEYAGRDYFVRGYRAERLYLVDLGDYDFRRRSPSSG